ncbi:hypothetical protein ILP92_03675 [Maribius pontilimi]|uniref:Nickel/cobalt transporter regulator n=1 Tax=Palleronia pontilimi TaxID=1964209 RepID=A0A934IET9_9RHOB|nr:hypothetical protein [Palleronia pontilimi]MBJ3761847.1 hypothetical protein [Palleronia pontilimi]
MRHLIVLIAIVFSSPAHACFKSVGEVECRSTSAFERTIDRQAGSWRSVPVSVRTAPRGPEIGSVLPREDFNILLGTAYLGLPPVRDGWVYVKLDRDIYRVDRTSLEILERIRD